MYSLHDYAAMMSDRVRVAAYREAIKQVVAPGDTVLDLGTGTGLFAFLSCLSGARKVYAVETNRAIELAIAISEENGFSDKIEFLRGSILDLDLPEQVDVIVSDLRGTLPLHGNHLSAIVDARQRFLKRGGKLIPSSDRIRIAVLSSEQAYVKHRSPWEATALPDLRFDKLSSALVDIPRKIAGICGELLTPPALWTTLDYVSLDNTGAVGEVTLTASRGGYAHGLCVWFDSVLSGDIGFTNNPSGAPLNYGQMFFPWTEPVLIYAGDQIRVLLTATMTDSTYSWAWRTHVRSLGQELERVIFEQPSIK